MEAEYIELVIDNKLIRIDKNDSMNVWTWREYKIKAGDWYKNKITLKINKKPYYKKHILSINRLPNILSRVVYKAHNADWDYTDTSNNNIIDHINNNSLDNRIENLRILTAQQNQFNTKAKGYCWSNKNKKWRAQIMINYKNKFLGHFETKEEAHQAYLNAKELYHKLPA